MQLCCSQWRPSSACVSFRPDQLCWAANCRARDRPSLQQMFRSQCFLLSGLQFTISGWGDIDWLSHLLKGHRERVSARVCAWVRFNFMLKSSWKCLHSERHSKKRQSMERKVNSSCRHQRDSSLNVSPDRQFISAAAKANRLALVLIWNSLSHWIDEAVFASTRT